MKIRMILIPTVALLVSCTVYQYSSWVNQYRPLDMTSLKVGMSEEIVRETIGPPGDVIGSRQYGDGDIVRVLQYLEIELASILNYHPFWDEIHKNYYLYFINDTLMQWGRPGDWEKEADKIYELRFNRPATLSRP